VLTSFRAYDLVAQLDDTRFAVLFPDTDTSGAQRALEKARKRATEMRIAERGRTLRIPPFRAVLSAPVDGEDATAAMARLRDALGQTDVADPSPIQLLS
jgi:GGDEF domain-containing protein